MQLGEHEEAAQGLNLLRKLESSDASPMATAYGSYDWMMMVMDSSPEAHPCSRPLKTLDLFPTKTTGLKNECSSTAKSSSCLTSTF